MRRSLVLVVSLMVVFLSACNTTQPYDYTALRQSKPASILVLPPLNDSTDVRATYSVLSTATRPLAESGYYVFPVALVDKTFRENGLQNPAEMHGVPLTKLRDIFGPDAVLYMTIEKHGVYYLVLASDVIVSVKGVLVDAKTGVTLWKGEAYASDSEGRQNSGGIVGMLVSALVDQVVNNLSDRSHFVGMVANNRLLSSGTQNGLLYGPRSPLYGKDK